MRLAGQVGLAGHGIIVYSLQSRAFERLTDFGGYPVWLPDGRRVMFVSGGRDFHVVDTRTRKVEKVFSVQRDIIGPPQLTRDGREVVFLTAGHRRRHLAPDAASVETDAMRYLPLLTLLAVFPLAFACGRDDSAGTRAAFKAQLDEEWKYWMEQYPEAATLVGYPGQSARWTDYSQPAIDARAAYLQKSLDRLRGVNRAHLDSGDQLNYDLYLDLLQTAVDGLRFHNDAMPVRFVTAGNLMMPVNQMGGVQQDVPRTISAMPTATRQDYENIIARLQGIGTLVDQTIALMERGIAAGLTPPAIVMRDVPGQAAAQMVADPAQSPLLDAFRRFPPAIPDAERAGLTKRATDAYVQVARPAFEKLRDFLGTRYLPACRQTTAAAALRDGPALYAYNVKWHTTTSLSPQQIHETGLAEVKRIRAEMDKVIAAAGFSGSYQEFVHFLRTDPRFYFTDAEALVSAYRDIAKRADPELAPLFGRLPQSPYGVKAVPEAAAPSQTTAYYEPGAFKIGRPGYMFANTYKLGMRPKWEMEALTLHEAVPGHHLQISLAQELEASPSSVRTPATLPMPKAGASTRSRSAARWGSTRIPTRSSAS